MTEHALDVHPLARVPHQRHRVCRHLGGWFSEMDDVLNNFDKPHRKRSRPMRNGSQATEFAFRADKHRVWASMSPLIRLRVASLRWGSASETALGGDNLRPVPVRA